jgi:hypothetical protein
MPINPIINLPARTQTPAVFSANADGVWTQVNTFATEANALAADVVTRQNDVITRQSDVATKQGQAATSASNAAASATIATGAVATSGAIAWASGTTYSVGNLAYSLLNFGTYRRKTNGAGTVDPSLDKTNWINANANSGGEIGELASFSTIVTNNLITSPSNGVYLKAGVQVSRAAALAANYEVAQLEIMGMCSPASATIPFTATAVAFGGGLFCIVGSTGQIATSPDGTTWTTRSSGTTDNLTVVEYLNGQFVATGTAWLGASTDGITWNTFTAPNNTNVKTSLTYVNGRYVASTNAGSTSAMSSSTDLNTWIAIDIQYVNAVYRWAYFSNAFYYTNSLGYTVSMDIEGTPKNVDLTTIGAGYLTTLNGKLFKFSGSSDTGRTSTDGINWSNFAPAAAVNGAPTNQSMSVAAYGNSVYVATTAAGMQSSSNGTTWTNRTAIAGLQGVTFLGGLFLAVGMSGANNIYTSSDGTTWTLRTPSVGMKAYSIAYSGSMYIAVGQNTGGTNLNIASSTDGVTWTNRVNSALGTGFTDVVYGNSRFVALPDTVGTIYYSTDGITWNSTTVSAVVSAGVSWNHIRFLNGYFIVSTQGQGLVYYSTDGITWSAATVTTPSSNLTSTTVNISDYQSGKYWGFGTNSQFSVADSISSWFSYVVGYYAASTIRMKTNGSIVLAFGASNGTGHLQVSGDGLAWASLKKPTDLTLDTTVPSDFYYANGQFVFTVGNKIVNSTNGLSWTSNTMGSVTTAVYGIAYGAGVWWFTGNNGYGYTTTDLSNFTLRYAAGTTPLSPPSPLRAVYGNSTFIGANINSGTSVSLTTDGVGGNIGAPLSPTNPLGTTFYVKVK